MDNKQITVLHGMTRAQVDGLIPVLEQLYMKASQPVEGGELVWSIPVEISEWFELMRSTCTR